MKQYKLYTTVGIIETDDDDIDNYVLHREDGPAVIWYYDDGSIWCEAWYWCGMIHRHDYTLPTTKFATGTCFYYWYGVKCKPEELLDKDFRDRIQLEMLG